MDAWRIFLASSLVVVGCTDVPPRSAVIAEQRRIEGAVKPGTSAQEAREALVSLGYSCREAQVEAASSDGAAHGTITECVKAIQDKGELHVCLGRTESQVKEVRYGLRPLCGA
ncbi:MAG TPA: hypothetical protein VMK12_08500 [Anaeromyxobacteraceae bacterium]|nr:hypothetical protein [Anaeromyxobacteraceae bacterium]